MGKPSSRSDEKSHADRKFDKKIQFYEKVRTEVARKAISKEKQQKKRSRQKKLKAYDLSSLADYLPELKAPTPRKPVEFKLNCKRRNGLVVKETNRLQTIIDHPIFQSDPLAAIYQHLQIHSLPWRRSLRERMVKLGRINKKRKSPKPHN